MNISFFQTFWVLVFFMFVSSCDEPQLKNDSLIQISQCLEEPRSPISEVNIFSSGISDVGVNFSINRSMNGDVTVRDLPNNCFVSIWAVNGEILDIQEGPVPRFASTSDQFRDTVSGAFQRFLIMCFNSNRFALEMRAIRNEHPGFGEALLPCEIIVERYSLTLPFRISEEGGVIGGVSFVDDKQFIWMNNDYI